MLIVIRGDPSRGLNKKGLTLKASGLFYYGSAFLVSFELFIWKIKVDNLTKSSS